MRQIVLVLAIVGCGGNRDSDERPVPTATNEAPAPTPPPAPAPPPTPAAPVPAPTHNVPIPVLEGSRIAGDKNIVPDDETKLAIQHAGKNRTVSSFRLCIDTAGAVTSVRTLKSSGFSAYDDKISVAIRDSWKYKPVNVDGKAVPVCSAVTFVYAQS